MLTPDLRRDESACAGEIPFPNRLTSRKNMFVFSAWEAIDRDNAIDEWTV